MDRLSIVAAAALLALLFGQCNAESPATPPPSRTVAVKAKPVEDPLPAFCDVLDPSERKPLQMPEVLGRSAGAPTGPRWINIWATWCKPCIEEMPLLVEWVNRLNKSGANLSLELVSADEDPETLKRFYQTHPTFPKSGRLSDPEALAPWIESVGLDAGAGLPIHIFTGLGGGIRCARAAGINPADFPAVQKLIK